jgi:hypothetical protein
MLKQSDTETVRQWLVEALELGRKTGKDAASLAIKCGVTAQAVSGWKRTGRITKRNLEIAIAYFGHGPSFIGEIRQATQSVNEPPALYGTVPALSVATRQRVEELSPEHRAGLEAVVTAYLDAVAPLHRLRKRRS